MSVQQLTISKSWGALEIMNLNSIDKLVVVMELNGVVLFDVDLIDQSFLLR